PAWGPRSAADCSRSGRSDDATDAAARAQWVIAVPAARSRQVAGPRDRAFQSPRRTARSPPFARARCATDRGCYASLRQVLLTARFHQPTSPPPTPPSDGDTHARSAIDGVRELPPEPRPGPRGAPRRRGWDRGLRRGREGGRDDE